MARKCKNEVCRKVYSVRITPDAYDLLSKTAELLSVSVSDLIQNYADCFIRARIHYNFPPVFWSKPLI